MKNFIFKYFIFFIGLFCSTQLFAQRLSATDTSEQSVRKYQNIIKNNKELVRFIEYSFSSRGIPKHMRNLAIIESHLDRNSISVAGASGVWQFMVGHANDYGLTDEDRNDMYKSTKAVTNSLINLYNKYQNWVTVVAAYNCGEGNVSKAMTKAGSKNYTDFKNFLPAETQNHVQKYLNASFATGELEAVLQDYYKTPKIQKNAVKKEIPKSKKAAIASVPTSQFNPDLAQTSINGAHNLDVIAEYLKISKSEILVLNPGIEKNLRERGETTLLLPKELMDTFIINKYKILAASLKK
ncbi:lytic transglycosylase domain-containing protein [Frigoriflavimonas asaccharolytica]|uniref:Membrane-bound lytic murein transglycosylase D n=1 Tax=Frigoriflavimonas asaccharolytica TaxID=2735899 RepID=A0A8J8G6T4_9FLAO|nr:lytic transglycosylase domain-containing protein [Frigoriflavimonas asaccharolytica]NRS92304.1 membrane-bound lytic murein transglycosylase D [Frigoriflavimonas asaccharolytica]